MDFAPVTEFVSRNWLFTLLLGAIGFLAKIIFELHGEKASLQAMISTLKERNTELKGGAKEEISARKAENIKLQKIVEEKCTQDALIS
jgi:hypothetical protein